MNWIPPKMEVCKLNFDSCSRGNPGDSGAGVCIRNYNGIVVCMLAQHLLVGTNNKVEAMALLLGLELALQLKLDNIHIEGDSTVVINSCVKKK